MVARGRSLGEPRLAPDGRRLAFVDSTGGRARLVVVDLDGGPERTVTTDPPPAAAHPYGGGVFDWTPDGEAFVYAGGEANPATGGLTEISRNGAQGDLFRHPYDIAVAGDGSLLVADMGSYATPTDRTPDGRIIRVDPVTGQQSLVTSGNLLVDPAGLAIAPGGLIYVIENVGTLGEPGVVSVELDRATGAVADSATPADRRYPEWFLEGTQPGAPAWPWSLFRLGPIFF